jgi:RNA polymerase sigma-70 factor (ECF subfamily)
VEDDMASRELAIGSDAFAGKAEAERGLVEMCRRGDAEAFARLVGIHESMVYNLSARLLGDGEEARDLSQDVFLQVYRTLGGFQGRSTLKTWIYRIVVNQARNRQRFWRRRRRERCCPIEDMTAADHARASARHPDAEAPFERLARGEQARQIQAALLKLSFDHRAILLLREVEELDCEEIAAALDIPQGTVKSRLARARDALRQAVTEDAR